MKLKNTHNSGCIGSQIEANSEVIVMSMKRFLSLLLAVIMVVGMVPAPAFAEETEPGGEIIAPVDGCSYESVVTEPTCTTGGYTTHTCTICGDSYVDSYVDATGHTWKVTFGFNDITGLDAKATLTCQTCGIVEVHDATISAVEYEAQNCQERSYTTFTYSYGEASTTYVKYGAYGPHTEVIDKAVAPTCTSTGLTEGKHCSVCGNVTIAQEVVPALGHTAGTAMKENVAEDGSYDSVVYCVVCGEEISRVHLINPFAGVAMDLGNTLQMNFVVNLGKLEGTDNYAVITRTYADGSIEVLDPIPQSAWTKYNGNLYQFSYSKIAAKEMTDVLYAVIYNAKGEVISITREESTRSYVMKNINSLLDTLAKNPTEKDRKKLTMMVDVLNYGAAAQENFKYNTGDLANSQLTEEMKQYASEDTTAENIMVRDDAFCAGTSLNLESRIQLRFVFRKSAMTNVAYAIVTHTKHNGGSVETRIEVANFEKYNSTLVFVPVNTLSGADGDQVVTCTLYDAQGNVITTAIESMNSNLMRSIDANGSKLAKMLLRLTKSAYEFFHA